MKTKELEVSDTLVVNNMNINNVNIPVSSLSNEGEGYIAVSSGNKIATVDALKVKWKEGKPSIPNLKTELNKDTIEERLTRLENSFNINRHKIIANLDGPGNDKHVGWVAQVGPVVFGHFIELETFNGKNVRNITNIRYYGEVPGPENEQSFIINLYSESKRIKLTKDSNGLLDIKTSDKDGVSGHAEYNWTYFYYIVGDNRCNLNDRFDEETTTGTLN